MVVLFFIVITNECRRTMWEWYSVGRICGVVGVYLRASSRWSISRNTACGVDMPNPAVTQAHSTMESSATTKHAMHSVTWCSSAKVSRLKIRRLNSEQGLMRWLRYYFWHSVPPTHTLHTRCTPHHCPCTRGLHTIRFMCCSDIGDHPRILCIALRNRRMKIACLSKGALLMSVFLHVSVFASVFEIVWWWSVVWCACM